MADYLALAAQLRAQRTAENQQRMAAGQLGGSATSNGGVIGQGAVGGPLGGFSPPQNQQQNPQQQNPLQTGLDAYNKYKDVSKLLGSGSPGAFAGATPATMGAMGTGGGSSLGSMGLMSSAAPVSFPGAAAAGGSATGGGAAAGGTMGALGGLGALAGLSYLGDKEMNENKGSIINADKLNNMGSVGGIGLRFGDLANGFNPATWLSDPKKAANGLGNFFTLGFLDKIF